MLPATRAAASLWYAERLAQAAGEGPDVLRDAERWLSRNDLFYLLVAVLNRRDMNREWLFDRCREVQAAPDGFIDLWAREHYKSTIITFGLTVQDILRTHGADLEDPPELTFGIFSHTRPIAKSFLRQIKLEFEANSKLKGLFPDVLHQNPHRDSPKWSEDDGIVVKRESNRREATVEAWGLVDGQPTSKHFDRLVYDDVVTQSSVSTPEMIEKVTAAWQLSLNLATSRGRFRYIGTRYHYGDSYRTMMDRGSVIPRVYPATDDGTPDGEPVLISRQALAEKRRDMGPYVFAAQMLVNPVADAVQGFKRSWLDYWPASNLSNLNLGIVCDPASKKRKRSDYTFMAVVGLGEDGVYRVVDMIRDRLNLTERADALFRLHRKYRPGPVGYEEYGLQADIEHMKDRMIRENYQFEITPLGGQLAKEDRIRRLIPLFEQRRILLPETCHRTNCEGKVEELTQVFVEQEYVAFPVGLHDDMLDGLSRITDEDFVLEAPRAIDLRKINPLGGPRHALGPHAWMGS